MLSRLRKPDPHAAFDWKKKENVPGAHAIHMVALGKATPEQQVLAMQTLVEDVCGYYDLSFSPGEPDIAAFAEGKRWVGATIVQLQRNPKLRPQSEEEKHG